MIDALIHSFFPVAVSYLFCRVEGIGAVRFGHIVTQLSDQYARDGEAITKNGQLKAMQIESMRA